MKTFGYTKYIIWDDKSDSLVNLAKDNNLESLIGINKYFKIKVINKLI